MIDIKITRDSLNPEEISTKVRKDTNGAGLTFLGTTRDFFMGKKVISLEYEAYEEMATKKLQEIALELQKRWAIPDIAFYHRIGRVDVGEISLVVALGSPHREEAFAACKYAVDRLKEIVPIWKKEVYEGGEVWVESEKQKQVTLTGQK
jgi:molybdopterin synthase catalytic subunit